MEVTPPFVASTSPSIQIAPASFEVPFSSDDRDACEATIVH
jgi:hypothetical protein